MKNAKSRIAHNKRKIKVNYLGFSSYEYENYQSHSLFSTLRAFTVIIGLTSLCLAYGNYNVEQDLINPLISINEVPKVQAVEVNPCELEETEILQYMCKVFGDDYQDAKTVSHCESKHDPLTVGDTHIMAYDYRYDEMVGDSIGLFQIRTGGNDNGHLWNRARANGMTADEFRTYLKDYKNNINYSKEIFDRQGWSPWTCKKDL